MITSVLEQCQSEWQDPSSRCYSFLCRISLNKALLFLNREHVNSPVGTGQPLNC